MKHKNFYLSVDLDREIFKDEQGHIFDTDEVRVILNEAISGTRPHPNLTMMAARLINEFNFDFAAARKFYETIS